MTTLDEMRQTFIDGDGLQDVKSGLLAVFERHVGPMIEAAVCIGADAQVGETMQISLTGRPRAYRETVITQLKASTNGE